MQRRTFMSIAAGAAAALAIKPIAFCRGARKEKSSAYPDPAFEAMDPRFGKYVGNAAVERLYTGSRWSEGPVWFRDGRYLLWSDIPNNRMLRWIEETGEVSVFRSPRTTATATTATGRAAAYLRARHAAGDAD